MIMAFSFLYADMSAFLEPEEAFIPKLVLENQMIGAEIILAKGIYLYQDKVTLEVLSPKEGKITYTLPKGHEHESFDAEEPEIVYYDKLRFDATLDPKTFTNASQVQLRLSYQGCSEQGLCYQPLTFEQTFPISMSDVKTTNADENIALSEEDEIKALFQKNILVVLAAFFGFGLLLSLTPCVFPMIPILSSIIVSQGDSITTKRAFSLSLIYVLAMSSAYTLAGVLAGLFGSNMQAALQTPWVIILFSLAFVALALSMFGFYQIQMPQWIQTRVTKSSKAAEGKGVIGVAVMGFLSALIVGPCVAAPLAGALAYIGETGDAILGGISLFVMSIGMGIPLLLVGVGAGKFMPKPGGWMDAVEAFFGVIMIGVAIWMIDRIVDHSMTMIMLSLLLMFSSIYLGAFDIIENVSSGWKKLRKGAGLILFIYGLMLFVGGLSKGTLAEPLKAFYSANQSSIKYESEGLVFTQTVTTLDQLDRILTTSFKPVMLDFTAKWCVQCKELEENTFNNPAVVKALENFLLVKADITEVNDQTNALKKRYGVFGPPAMRFFKKGKELRASRVQGDVGAKKFLLSIPK